MHKKTEEYTRKNLLKLGFWSLGIAFLSYFLLEKAFSQLFLRYACRGMGCDWSLMEGYAGLVTLALLIGGLVFAAREYIRQESQISQQESQISFEIYQAIHTKLTQPENEAARRWILLNIPVLDGNINKEAWLNDVSQKLHQKPRGWREAIAPGHQHLKNVLNTLDYFGFIAENYVNVEGALLEWMSAPVAKVWERISPYIEDEREKRKEPDFYKSAFYIGERCLKWRTEKGYQSEIIESGT